MRTKKEKSQVTLTPGIWIGKSQSYGVELACFEGARRFTRSKGFLAFPDEAILIQSTTVRRIQNQLGFKLNVGDAVRLDVVPTAKVHVTAKPRTVIPPKKKRRLKK